MIKELMEKIVRVITKGSRVNYRDRRGHYASGNLSCLRDQFWSYKGEPETNPSDFKGAMKMMIGDAIEKGLIDHIFTKLSFFGFHFRGTQVPVGQSNPDWDGYLDLLLYRQEGDKWYPFVGEIKTKSGYGANLFLANPEPSPEYMTQIGLYLRNMHEKGITNKGVFIFVLLSDDTFGDIVLVNVEYDGQTKVATATNWVNSRLEEGVLQNVSIDTEAALDRWRKLNEFLKTNTVPAGEYEYKYPLTFDSVKDSADAKLKKIIERAIVYGDWQPLYSRYKNKQLEADGLTAQRTEDELNVARIEYRRRHPRSKI